MAHVDIVLRTPSYGWKTADGELVRPSTRQILAEFADRMNVFRSRKHWLPLTNWFGSLYMFPFLVAFFVLYFSWPLLLAGFVYGMVFMGSHGTVWYHRFGTHKAFEFSHGFWRFLTRNLVLKMVPEEIYIVSHFVHHSKADQPGDPYNPKGGILYCFLADALHQPISHDLSEAEYQKACGYVAHTGMPMNSYAQYQVWGTIAHPASLWAHCLANWSFWFGVFYLAGGMPLVCALFGSACVWSVGVRTFNYGAHGSGADLRREGEDFNRKDLSINQIWPGIVAGEWHNNHHLFANSARSGYKPWQIDLPYYYIRLLHMMGGVSRYNDSKEHFYRKHYQPWLEERAPMRNPADS
jgi:fatty-acid desaturase